jgi:hypothetical protein
VGVTGGLGVDDFIGAQVRKHLDPHALIRAHRRLADVHFKCCVCAREHLVDIGESTGDDFISDEAYDAQLEVVFGIGERVGNGPDNPASDDLFWFEADVAVRDRELVLTRTWFRKLSSRDVVLEVEVVHLWGGPWRDPW